MRRIMLSVLAVTLAVGIAACQPEDGVSLGPGNTPTETSVPVPTPADEPSPSPSSEPSVEPSVQPSPTPELSPSPSRAAPTPSKSPSKSSSPDCAQGEHQQAVEAALDKLGGFGTVTVDGVQSAADCAAIKKFQKRFDIRPAYGRAGPLTLNVVKRLVASRASRCEAGSGLTACVDLTNQTVWIMRGGEVIYGPTPTRTGFSGYATPTGTYSIHDKALRSWSNDWDVWLPYWQRIVRGIGFHETTTYIHDMSLGSHGCVNLLPVDAVKFYEILKVGTAVKVFGHRAGT